MGEIIARNMLSWWNLLIKSLLFLHLVGCLYYRSYESTIVVGKSPTASLLNVFIYIFRPVCIGVSYANIRGAAFVFVKGNTNILR